MNDHRPAKQKIELTLTIEGHYERSQLIEDWTPDHTYGPVQNVSIQREGHSANRSYDVIDVDASVVTDGKSQTLSATDIPTAELQALIGSWREAAKHASDMVNKPHSNTSLFLGVKATRHDCADKLERLIESNDE